MQKTQNLAQNINMPASPVGCINRPQVIAPEVPASVKAEAQPAQVPTFAYPQNYYLSSPANSIKSTLAQNLYQAPTQPADCSSQYKTIQTPSSGVNIMIFNPSAAPPNGSVNNSCNYHIPGYVQQQPACPVAQQPVIPQTNIEPEEKKDKEKTYKKDVTELTDNLIKSLENYLRNPNKSIRQQGIKELISLLKEDSETRKNDIALNNLLNLALQDNDATTRLLALSAFQEGIATGDDFTTKLLDKISKTQTGDGVEQELAANAALARLKNKISVETKTPPKEFKKEV